MDNIIKYYFNIIEKVVKPEIIKREIKPSNE